VPACPTAALIDDLIPCNFGEFSNLGTTAPLPHRAKSIPQDELRRLVLSFPDYCGLRVGVVIGCQRSYISKDRTVIPADARAYERNSD
jgi:hypothetical protein